jgi:hypothetical protein
MVLHGFPQDTECRINKLVEIIRGPLTDTNTKESAMTLGTILLIIFILLLIGAIPTWPYSRGWGYGPSGILGVILIVVIVLLLMGRI